ncbi:MAG: Nitrilase/cyanide hydratase and apolipoprotein N-acyltransferase [Micrococcaceae bacterium]|nr:Nitrilase/cyanide hydratase and apolipoprotein N-acyltransferase [Micrococcaceae bacterium]
MLLALLQANAVVMDIEANHAIIDAAARDAAAAGAFVLVTPELFTVGYAPQRVRA